jgi:hypothetical protein
MIRNALGIAVLAITCFLTWLVAPETEGSQELLNWLEERLLK